MKLSASSILAAVLLASTASAAPLVPRNHILGRGAIKSSAGAKPSANAKPSAGAKSAAAAYCKVLSGYIDIESD